MRSASERRWIRRTEDWLLTQLNAFRPVDLGDTIVLVGSSRSGTTWLLEVIRSHPNYRAITEPLSPEVAAEVGFDRRRSYIARSEARPDQAAYVDRLLEGQPPRPRTAGTVSRR